MVDEKLDAQKKKKLEELIGGAAGGLGAPAAAAAAAPQPPIAAASAPALDSGALKTRDTNAPPPRAAATVKGMPKPAASSKGLGATGKARLRARAKFRPVLAHGMSACITHCCLSRSLPSTGDEEGGRRRR